MTCKTILNSMRAAPGRELSPVTVCTLAIAVCAQWVAASPASACTAADCKSFVPARGGSIPSNAPALAWMSPNDIEWGDVKLTRIDGDAPQEVKITVEAHDDQVRWLRPSELVAGARYRLEQRDPDMNTGRCSLESEFSVVEAAPLPKALGRAVATRSDLDAAGYPCVSADPFVAAHSAVYLSLDEQAEPWKDLWLWRGGVDGEMESAWRSGLSIDLDPLLQAYTSCGAAKSRPLTWSPFVGAHKTDPGTHDAVIEALLPGETEVLATPEEELELQCGTLPAVPAQQAEAQTAKPAMAESDETNVESTPEASGCSVTGSPTPRADRGTVWMLSLAAALLCGFTRRRLRRSQRSPCCRAAAAYGGGHQVAQLAPGVRYSEPSACRGVQDSTRRF